MDWSLETNRYSQQGEGGEWWWRWWGSRPLCGGAESVLLTEISEALVTNRPGWGIVTETVGIVLFI